MIFYNRNSNPTGCFIFGILGLVVLFYFLSWFYRIAWYATPFLLIGALIINYRVVADSLRGLTVLLKRNPFGGILATLLGVAMLPFLSIYWFFGALNYDSMKKMNRQFQGGIFGQPNQPAEEETDDGFIDFEEIDSKPLDDLEPPEKLERE